MLRSGPLALTLALAAAGPADDNWTQFRGGDKGGVAEAKTLPDEWGDGKNVVWKADVPGRGWSSPVVWGDRVFVTTAASVGR